MKSLKISKYIFSFRPIPGVSYKEFIRCNTKTESVGFWRKWEWYTKYQRNYQRKHREKWRKWVRDWTRKHRVGTGRRFIYGTKRDYPEEGKCELCNKSKFLVYHHYDDNNLMKGIWLCTKCHRFVESYEKGYFRYLSKYLTLKTRILEEAHQNA